MVTIKGLEGLLEQCGYECTRCTPVWEHPRPVGRRGGCIEELLVCLEDHPKVNWLMLSEDSDSEGLRSLMDKASREGFMKALAFAMGPDG